MTKFVCCALLGLCVCTQNARSEQPPAKERVQIELLTIERFARNSKSYMLRLDLTNESDAPKWFVLPFAGEDSLPVNGIFIDDAQPKQPFGGKAFKGDNGAAMDVQMNGVFDAFLVPAKGEIRLDGFNQFVTKPIEGIEVMVADRLLVNGKTPLEKWLPYKVMSDKNVRVESEAMRRGWTNLDFDRKTFKVRTDYPAEAVVNVTAAGFRKVNAQFVTKK